VCVCGGGGGAGLFVHACCAGCMLALIGSTHVWPACLYVYTKEGGVRAGVLIGGCCCCPLYYECDHCLTAAAAAADEGENDDADPEEGA
jgi:hypothetical protein